MDSNLDRASPLSAVTTVRLEKLNELYMNDPYAKLPFDHEAILEELISHRGQDISLHRDALREPIYGEITLEAHKRRRITRRPALTVLLVILICIALCGIACAVFPSLFSFAREGDTMSLRGNSGELTIKYEEEFKSLEEALAVYDLEELSPKWIPADFSLECASIDAGGNTDLVAAWYETEDGRGISVIVSVMNSDSLSTVSNSCEVDGDSYEKVIISGQV